jgi:hypothetical protein
MKRRQLQQILIPGNYPIRVAVDGEPQKVVILRIPTAPNRGRDGDPFRDPRKQFKKPLTIRPGDVGIEFRPRQRFGQFPQCFLRHYGLRTIQEPTNYVRSLGVREQQPAEEYICIQDDPFSHPYAATMRVFARSARAQQLSGRRDHKKPGSRQRPARADARILAARLRLLDHVIGGESPPVLAARHPRVQRSFVLHQLRI